MAEWQNAKGEMGKVKCERENGLKAERVKSLKVYNVQESCKFCSVNVYHLLL